MVSEKLHTSVLMIMADHQTFSSQFWGLSGQILDTFAIYIVDGKVGVCIIGKKTSDKSSQLLS